MRLPWAHKSKPVTQRFEGWAYAGVPPGEGLKMLAAQAANEVLRRCRIGKVTRKAPR